MIAQASQEIRRVAVIGTGYMGGGIAQSFALAGADVTIADADGELTRRNLDRLIAEGALFESAQLVPPGSTEILRERLHAARSIDEAVADADFIEEAVFEEPDVKLAVLRRIDAARAAHSIVGSNTSTIPVKVLSRAFTDPSRFLTVHFSNPAPFIPGVEIVAGEHTDPAVVETVEALLDRMGRRTARVADVPGFVLNRLQYVLLKEAMAVVEEGIATPADVDTVVSTTFGYRLPFFGPFAIADMAGLDVYVRGFATMEDEFGDRLATPAVLQSLVDAGHHGTKSGRGFYALDPERRAELVAWRDKAYVMLGKLLEELGPSPLRKASPVSEPVHHAHGRAAAVEPV